MRVMTTRRRGFFSAHALLWILLCSLIAGIAVERATHIVSSWRDVSPDVVQHAHAAAGIDAAEEWLYSAFESGDAPRARNVYATDPLKKIEAVRVGGDAFDVDAALPGLGVEVWIADTSFDITIFPSSVPPYAVPVMSHEAPCAENGERMRYYYFIRSTAGSNARNYQTVCEELLQFDVDATFGTVADVRRIFFRSGTEPR